MAKRGKGLPDLSYIHESLRAMAVPIGELVADPANARKHSQANLQAIRGSLVQYGQRRAAVVQKKGMIVRAGNGMLQAAIALGWTHLACLQVDDDDISAVGFAIADNRTAELAEWDVEALRQLMPMVEVGDEMLQQMHADLCAEFEIVEGLSEAEAAEQAAAEESQPPVAKRYQVLITVADEDAQRTLLARMSAEGYECRALTV
jgi:ParB-like chromosome segregation protein Spo0J